MIQVKQTSAWEVVQPASGLLEWLRSALSGLNALFASWKNEGDDEELSGAGAADPELVAALQFIASLLSDEPEGKGRSV